MYKKVISNNETIFTGEVDKNFTKINNDILDDKRLSDGAIGLYSRIMKNRINKNWILYIDGLTTDKTKRTAIRTSIDMLIKAGWIIKEEIRNSNGAFKGYRYTVKSNNPKLDNLTSVTVSKNNENGSIEQIEGQTSIFDIPTSENRTLSKDSNISIINISSIVSSTNLRFLETLTPSNNKIALEGEIVNIAHCYGSEFINTVIDYSKGKANQLGYIVSVLKRNIKRGVNTTKKFLESIKSNLDKKELKRKQKEEAILKALREKEEAIKNANIKLDVEKSIDAEAENAINNVLESVIENGQDISNELILLKSVIDDLKFNTWIKHLKAYRLKNRLVVVAPNVFFMHKAKEYIAHFMHCFKQCNIYFINEEF